MTDDLDKLRAMAEREWDNMPPETNIHPYRTKKAWIEARASGLIHPNCYGHPKYAPSVTFDARRKGWIECAVDRLDVWLESQPWYVQLVTLAGISSVVTYGVLELGALLARIVP